MFRNTYAPSAPSAGRASGTAMVSRKRQLEQPSRLAASLSSLGKVRKFWRIRKMPMAEYREGIDFFRNISTNCTSTAMTSRVSFLRRRTIMPPPPGNSPARGRP